MWGALLLTKYARRVAEAGGGGGGGGEEIGAAVRDSFKEVKESLNLLSLDTIGDYAVLYSGTTAGRAVETLGGREEVLRVLRMRGDYDERFKLV